MDFSDIPRGQLSTIILISLLSGDKYGLEIIKEIENQTNGKVVIKQPSLYSSLTRMENQNLISFIGEIAKLVAKDTIID